MNPALGVPGFPDCQIDGDAVAAGAAPELALECAQKPKDFGGQIAIGTIGDSITAGVHSTGGNHTYPFQLVQGPTDSWTDFGGFRELASSPCTSACSA